MARWRLNKFIFLLPVMLLLGVFFIGGVSAILWDNTVYWKFDEASGTIYDSVGNVNLSQVRTPSYNQTGKIKGSIYLDSSGDALTNTADATHFSYTNTQDLTLNFWVKSSDYSNIGAPYGSGESVLFAVIQPVSTTLYLSGDATQRLGVFMGSINLYANYLKLNDWNMITRIRNNSGTDHYLFINGVYNSSLLGQATASSTANNITFGDFRNDRRPNQYVDEFGFWKDRALNGAEVLALYNGSSGNPCSYGDEACVSEGTPSISVNLTSPTNNSVITTSNQSFLVNLTMSGTNYSYQWRNNTYNIWFNNGTLFKTNFTNGLGGNNTNISTNISGFTTNNYIWNSYACYGNTTASNCTWATNNYTFRVDTRVNIRIINPAGAYVSDGVTYVNYVYYNTNNMFLEEGSLQSRNGNTLTINASSLSGNYGKNDTSIIINSSISVYNITLDSYKLYLRFFHTNGSLVNISGYVSDLVKSYTFTNQSYLKEQGDFDNNLIYIRFVTGIYNASVPNTWENKSQFYEYDNSVPYTVNENITMFTTIDTSSYFQVQDNAGNFIKNAVIRIYGIIPSNVSWGNSTYGFFGQRITDSNGLTVFPMDSDMEILVTVVASGYKTESFRLTASEITTFTATDPKVLRMQKSAYTAKSNVFLGTLYKMVGTRIFQSKYDNISSNYYMFIYDYYDRALLYSTSYEGINRSISMDNTTKTGVIALNSGQQFSSASNASWTLYIWVDGVKTYEIIFAFESIPQEVIFDIEDLGLKNSDAWRAIVFFLVITISSIIGLTFGAGAGEDISVHAFFIGCFIATMMVSGLGWLALTGGFFYFGKMIKKFYSE